MKLLVSGSSGLIGKAFLERADGAGHDVQRLVRRAAAAPDEVLWDPEGASLDASALEGFDGVVHLAGESIAEGRWTESKMRRIRDSRVRGTRLLCETLAALENPPKVLVCASAVGFYGDRGEESLDEGAASGDGFLAETCRLWEDACRPAKEAGIRVVQLRIGVVLAREGGALAKMLLPFQLGLAGRIGNGRQWMSWIELGDVVEAIHHSLVTDTVEGPVNAVSPHPVTNAEYTKTLGKVLKRPTLFPLPAFGARAALGKMADELLLASMRVKPNALQGSGFAFRWPELDGALRHVLGKGTG